MSENPKAKKGHATPSRKSREAANARPLVGAKTPEAKKANRDAIRADRNRARAGMMAGEEKYLPAKDRGAQKKFARDFVDSKFTLGELMMPSLLVVILLSAVDSYIVQLATLLTMWALFFAVAINAWLTGRKINQLLTAKHGASRVERGLTWYAAMRSIQLRSMRIPRPQVKRGTKVAP